MKIMKKAKYISDAIAGGDGKLAERIQSQAVAAILGGRTSSAWEAYMKNFCSNASQLTRLKGDDDILSLKYGPLVLAYFAGDGNCGGGTTTRIGREMIPKMKELVEGDLSTDTEPEFKDEFHESPKFFNVADDI